VRAHANVLHATYLPKDAGVADAVPEILGKVSGIQDLHCSMASTNILWVQECFEPDAPAFASVARVAERWNAAVELLRVVPRLEASDREAPAEAPPPGIQRERDGGIEDDRPSELSSPPGCNDAGLRGVHAELTHRGIAGGLRTALAHPRQIALALDRTVPYSLVVVGNVFTAKGHAASERMTRELAAQLADDLKVPVVRAGDLEAQYLTGRWQLLRLVGYALVVALLYALVFTHQREVLRFLTPESGGAQALAAGVLLLLIPTVAYLYGTVAKSLLKLVKIE
jgi:hypothetical protein